MLQYNKVDSENYNFKIYRGNENSVDIEGINKQIVDNSIDIAILRIPSRHQANLYQFFDLGYNIVVADYLVEYTVKYNKNLIPPPPNDKVEFILGTNANKEEIFILLRSTFAGYSNHYKSNPYLPGLNSLHGYEKWVDECINGDGVVYLVKYNGENAAFFSGRIINNCFMGGPGGVDSNFEGYGINSDIHTQMPFLLFKNHGVKMCRTGTQIQNHAVQKQWALSGWTLSYTWATIHINAFLAKCYEGRKFEIDVNTSPDVQNVGGILNILNTYLTQYQILSSNIKKHKNTFTHNLFLHISDPMMNYSSGNDEALIAAIVINNSGQLVYTAQIFITK